MDAREWTVAAKARNGMAAPGITSPTPVAKANAAALCPEGNERERGHRHLSCKRHSGRVRAATASGELEAEVDDGRRHCEGGDTAARRAPAARAAEELWAVAAASESFE